MFSWAPNPQHLESYLRLSKCSLLVSEGAQAPAHFTSTCGFGLDSPSLAGWPRPQSPRPGGSWTVPLMALAVDVTQSKVGAGRTADS